MKSDFIEFEVEAGPSDQLSFPCVSVCAGFVYAGILVGSVLGIYEAALLYSRPPYSVVARPDLSLLIFLAAPLIDLLVFGLLGLVLGYIAEKRSSAGRSYVRWLYPGGLGLAGGFAAGTSYLRFWWDKYPGLPILAFVVIAGGVGVSVLANAAFRKWEHRGGGFSPHENAQWVRRLRIGAVGIGVILLGSVAVHEIRGIESIAVPPPLLSAAAGKPNIILITLDAATADHFSCYGYSQRTTPNLDGLAKRGVQFDNAIAPSSWTLPSFASMFTGLYPHQQGADFLSPLPERFPTIAMALKSAGYQTAGFNANMAYGQTSQGIARGFDRYEDGSENLRQNFVQTLFGRALVKFIYMRFVRPERPERQNAEEINRDVFRWFSHRTRRPYFLFINYFDVHDPYFAPRPYSKRFGELPYGVERRIRDEIGGAERPTLSSADQASLVAGYDNTLAYADNQIDVLLQFLAKSPDWSNTVVIITADHGDTFGEHGPYLHGMNLWRELVHVPLIIVGPGVPAGVRVRRAVGTRRLYATILGFAEGSKQGPPTPSSLQNYWTGNQDSNPTSPVVVSELGASPANPLLQNTYISLTTPQWHWILDSHGHSQLFDWVNDPQEKADLAGSSEASAVVETLQRSLRERVMTSARPWAGLSYLQPLGLGSPPPVNPQLHDLLDSLPYQ
jgi:arylsulfatase A-like enzyme